MSEMTRWWEVGDLEEAWYKTTSVPREEPESADRAVDVILAGIPPGEAALEIGPGLGRIMKRLAGHFQSVSGVDFSKTIVRFAQEYLRKLPQCRVVLSNGRSLPFPVASFDFVYSFLCFQHMHDLETIQANVEESYRVLKPGGQCRIQTVNVAPFRDAAEGNHGWGFPDPRHFLEEFKRVGFAARVEVGLTHFQHIWITAIK